MFRFMFALPALVIFALAAIAPAQAFVGDREDEARGMVVFSLPFGDGNAKPQSPAFSLQFGMRANFTSFGQDDRYDSESGARLPDFALEPLHSWSLEPGKPTEAIAAPPADALADR